MLELLSSALEEKLIMDGSSWETNGRRIMMTGGDVKYLLAQIWMRCLV
jgi:hypothetical protein